MGKEPESLRCMFIDCSAISFDKISMKLQSYVAANKIAAAHVLIIKDGRYLDAREYTVRVGGEIKASRVHIANHFIDGATVVLYNTQLYVDAMANLARRIHDYFNLNSIPNINVYIAPAETIGVPRHVDRWDVLVVQLQGEKEWDISIREGARSNSLITRNGSVLFMPANTEHATKTSSNFSVHLTIGIKDFLHYPYKAWDVVKIISDMRDGVDLSSIINSKLNCGYFESLSNYRDSKDDNVLIIGSEEEFKSVPSVLADRVHEMLKDGMISIDKMKEVMGRHFDTAVRALLANGCLVCTKPDKQTLIYKKEEEDFPDRVPPRRLKIMGN
ncbi:JmjC domain-containing protein [Chromobacterium amazonense]|uniref:JmjC domain-containing protein n=1 Tax=Chromobacterium amazonense TaxID=1382803 RepID=UPI003F78D134